MASNVPSLYVVDANSGKTRTKGINMNAGIFIELENMFVENMSMRCIR